MTAPAADAVCDVMLSLAIWHAQGLSAAVIMAILSGHADVYSGL